MSELERALARRNVRLKAWADLGVPVEGGWVRHESGQGWRLQIGCSVCRTREADYSGEGYLATLLDRLGALERSVLFELVEPWPGKCPHLAPLLGPEPPEVSALIPLLLLEDPSLGGGR